MNPTRLPLLLAALVLASCGGKHDIESAAAIVPPQPMVAARLLTAPPPAAVPLAPVPSAAVVPSPVSEPMAVVPATAKRGEGPPLAQVAAAHRAAVREPSRAGHIEAAQVYGWTEGAVYRLYAAPERVSDIALEPGETLVSVAAGDTARWVIGDTASGAGAARRTHVLVKPVVEGLATNLVIATDRRVYHLELASSRGGAMTSLSWTYPQGALVALDRQDARALVGEPVAAGVNLERLDFGYAIEGDDPPWRPLRAFDDGVQVFIEFPEGLARGEAPPLFVSGEGGAAELVNYRLRGRFYVVDRLFAAAELRLGERRQQVVRVVRTAGRGEDR